VLDPKCKSNYRRTGVKSIKNGARHSYCSYHLAYYNDIDGLTLQSGPQDTQTLWDHYYTAAAKADAASFWEVRPR
jgi:hypothetical protein